MVCPGTSQVLGSRDRLIVPSLPLHHQDSGVLVIPRCASPYALSAGGAGSVSPQLARGSRVPRRLRNGDALTRVNPRTGVSPEGPHPRRQGSDEAFTTLRRAPQKGPSVDLKLEVVPIPVSDVDAAKTFYTERVGFHLDHDVRPNEHMRVVQMTPPGSPCSVVLGEGLPLGEPGSVKGVQLVVEDIDATREALVGRGVSVSDVQQLGPEGAPGSRFAFFEDLDGNAWAIQELRRS
jgi:catechol 2,3-dioxygenase-like lactoylglutathione lyase family enzyme